MSNKLNNKKDIFEKNLTLNDARTGKTYKILSCDLPHAVKTRLFEMGLTPNAQLTVLQKAPLGDPLQISVRGYCLCIRAKDAKHFTISEVTP